MTEKEPKTLEQIMWSIHPDDNKIRRTKPMAHQSPKCALELSQNIPTDIVSDWWRLIHSGWKYPLSYIHGGAMCCPRECSDELFFLHKIGTAIHETSILEGYSK